MNEPGVILYLESSNPANSAKLLQMINNYDDRLTKRESIGEAHVVFLQPAPTSCADSLSIAEGIIQDLDSENLLFRGRLRVRIGVAAGQIDSESPFGRGVYQDAQELCAQAGWDEIFVNNAVRVGSGYPGYRFHETASRQIYTLSARRLMHSALTDLFGNGFVALYPNRKALSQDFRPARLVDLASQHSTLLVAGRTLISWSSLLPELERISEDHNVKFNFLLSSVKSCEILGPEQQREIEKDSPIAKGVFQELISLNPERFDVRETDQAVVDGILAVRVTLPSATANSSEVLLVIQDINAATGDSKPSLLFACRNDQEHCECMAHGLLHRTMHRFNQSEPLQPKSRSAFQTPGQSGEGLSSRRNRPLDYVARLKEHFDAIRAMEDERTFQSIPPPLSVQFQITGICSTHCVMCDHHHASSQGLSSDEWERIFEDVASFGVQNCIFSGGEPLMRKDIIRLVRSAKKSGFNIGLLTNGTMSSTDADFRQALLESIYDDVDWVAISIDGIPEDDYKIRQPAISGDRMDRLREFCEYFRGRISDEEKYRRFLSATVTLQKGNVETDLRALCEFIHQDFGISHVNFKLATGDHSTLSQPTDYLLDDSHLEDLQRFLWHGKLSDESGNNLDYLRRCFARGIFRTADAASGSPLRGYYNDHSLRCFAPYLFALIDLDGTVYPCCHLYRDNHGLDPRSHALRSKHDLGSLLESSFEEVWNGDKYNKKRKDLALIRADGDYAPCGECTRYCQHNIALDRIYSEYKRDAKQLLALPVGTDPVWI